MISGEFNEAAHLKWLEEHPTKRPKIKEARKQVEKIQLISVCHDISHAVIYIR